MLVTAEERLAMLRDIGTPDWLGSKSELEIWFDQYCAIVDGTPAVCKDCEVIVDLDRKGASTHVIGEDRLIFAVLCAGCLYDRRYPEDA